MRPVWPALSILFLSVALPRAAIGADGAVLGLDGKPAAGAPVPVRMAQRWTPLTGPLAPEGGTPEPGQSTNPPPSAPADPVPAPSTPVDSGPPPELQQLKIKATLASATGADGLTFGYLGLRSTTVEEDLGKALGLGEARGALVTEVVRGGAAEAAQVQAGDIIKSIGGRTISTHEDLVRVVRSFRPGEEIEIEHVRVGAGANDLRRFLLLKANGGDLSGAVGLARLLYQGTLLRKDEAEAARLLRQAADGGHVPAMVSYASMLKSGIGLPRDEAQSAKWFLKAAEAGNAAAMGSLGIVYETGSGAGKDEAEAARWYRKAADSGQSFAMLRLAMLYESGRGVEKDEAEAARLLRSASDKGDSEATSRLAEKYRLGRGVAKDEAEAARLDTQAATFLRRAADQGNAVSMFNLGILHRIGKGVPKSDAEARRFVIGAFKRGDIYLVAELMRNPNILAPQDRKWLQAQLKAEGTYDGPVDGKFTPAVRSAMEKLAGRP